VQDGGSECTLFGDNCDLNLLPSVGGDVTRTMEPQISIYMKGAGSVDLLTDNVHASKKLDRAQILVVRNGGILQ
jgi:hypothetical protein